MSELQKEFEKMAKISAQLVIDIQDSVIDLKKKELNRVFMAVMEYPVPPNKDLINQTEVDVYKMGAALKEIQLKMGMLNLAIREQEKLNDSKD